MIRFLHTAWMRNFDAYGKVDLKLNLSRLIKTSYNVTKHPPGCALGYLQIWKYLDISSSIIKRFEASAGKRDDNCRIILFLGSRVFLLFSVPKNSWLSLIKISCSHNAI